MSKKGLFGSVKTSYHNSGEVNVDVESKNSGTYHKHNVYGDTTEKITRNGKTYKKDSDGVYRDSDGKKLND